MNRRHVDTDILAGRKMTEMDGRCLLGCRQLGHAVEKRFDRLRHPPFHGLVDYAVRVLFLAIHGKDKRPVTPGIAVALMKQGRELRVGLFNIAGDAQRNGIARNQLIVSAIAHGQLVILLGIAIPSDKVIGETAICGDLAQSNAIGNCLIEITQRTKRIFLGQQRSAEADLHPAAGGINLVRFGEKADRSAHVAQFQRRQTGIRQRRGIVGISRNPAQCILQVIGIGLAAGLGDSRQMRNSRPDQRRRHDQ